MHRPLFILLLFFSLSLSAQESSPQDERIRALIGDRATLNTTLPVRGMRGSQVQRDFGAPEQKMPAVGKPPISRWIYPDYIVTFESDYVINATLKHRLPLPQPLPAGSMPEAGTLVVIPTSGVPAAPVPESQTDEAGRVDGLY